MKKGFPRQHKQTVVPGHIFSVIFILLLSLRWRSHQLAEGNARNDSLSPDSLGQRAMKIDNDDVSYVSDTEENQRSLSFCHITRVPRVNTHSHAHRDSRTCSAHVFRLPDGNRRNSRVKRDSLPDITRKANAALSHRWRVISRIRVSLPRVTGLSPFARTNFRTHTTRGTCLRFPVSRGNYENVEESMEDPRQRIDSGKRANEN